jgi:hypothetical protein
MVGIPEITDLILKSWKEQTGATGSNKKQKTK